MSRTTSQAVKAILMRDYDTVDTPALASCLEEAEILTDDVEAYALARGVTMTAARLRVIEGNLAAHFYTGSDKPYQEEWTDKSKAIYQGKTGMYLERSYYGQKAVTLDRSGFLASLARGTTATATLTWGGKSVPEQLDYDDREL